VERKRLLVRRKAKRAMLIMIPIVKSRLRVLRN
jgi:hypothetical protein